MSSGENSKGNSKIARMHRAAWVFARGGTWAEAASRAGVSAQTLSRYRRSPEWPGILAEHEERGALSPETVVRLVPPDKDPDELPSNWRGLASLQLAMAAQPAARLLVDAMNGADVSRAQLDTARWIVERMGIAAPEEAPPDELTTSDEVIDALANELDERILVAALARKRGA